MFLRVIVLGLLATLASVSVAAATQKTAKDQNDLIGPVRTVTTKARGLSETETYDLAGRLIEAVVYREHDNTSTRYVFTYRRQGEVQEETAYEADGTLIYRKQFAYAYNPAGRETAVVAAFQDGGFHHAEFLTYDRYGNVSEMIHTDGTITSRNLFDVLGRILYSGRFKDGQLFSEVKRTYDNRERLIELISYNQNGAVAGRIINAYDDSGHRVQATTETFQAGMTNKWTTTYEFDGTGNWIKELTRKEMSAPPEIEVSPSETVQERVIDYYEIR